MSGITNELTSEFNLRSKYTCYCSTYSVTVMEPDIILNCSRQPTTCLYLGPDKSTPCPHTLLFYYVFWYYLIYAYFFSITSPLQVSWHCFINVFKIYYSVPSWRHKPRRNVSSTDMHDLLLHGSLCLRRLYPGLQWHEETPSSVRHISFCAESHVESSPTVHMSILQDSVLLQSTVAEDNSTLYRQTRGHTIM